MNVASTPPVRWFTLKRIAFGTLAIGVLQAIAVGLSWRSDNIGGPFLLLGSVTAIFYSLWQLVHLGRYRRHPQEMNPRSLRTYYIPALVLAAISVITGTSGGLPGIGQKIAEGLEVATLILTMSWFRVATRLIRD